MKITRALSHLPSFLKTIINTIGMISMDLWIKDKISEAFKSIRFRVPRRASLAIKRDFGVVCDDRPHQKGISAGR
jgi:hypothetical protein